jgi:hypothetical protein
MLVCAAIVVMCERGPNGVQTRDELDESAR